MLGVTIDNKLNYKSYISELRKKKKLAKIALKLSKRFQEMISF